jgi:hypothetical protein
VTAVASLAWVRPLFLLAFACLGAACVEIPEPVDATFAPPQPSEPSHYRARAGRSPSSHASASAMQANADGGATP